MKPIHSLILLPLVAAFAAAPVIAADSNDTTNSSEGYKYNRSMNSGGVAGGSTVPRGAEQPTDKSVKKTESDGYAYDKSLNAGGRAGGSTVPREPKTKERAVN
jgi:hypothetical protein